jgi:HD-GYP domain-containing protein (c-di-GMP phosphodiesterase class II)
MKRMKRKGLDKILFRRGVTSDEMKTFLSELAESDRMSGQYQNISCGIVEVRFAGDGSADVAAVMNENVGRIREVYHSVSRFKKLDIVGLEDVVVSFISTLRQEANILKVISPVKSYSEYTYAHNTNVAVLSIFQAEALGMGNDLLHDIGMAGLLHDIGKMFISKEVLEKQTKLDEREWAEMQKHPVYGALYLAKLPDIPKHAMIAAYEHHMKFNGKGYPEARRKSGRQHIISQIIAVSDFFDALRTDRPYRKSLEVPVIVSLMKESSGKDFNPQLVENFIMSLKKVTAVV